MLDKIKIVLINTSHPGNIGSAARAMKTMGLSSLYLVAPQQFPHQQARDLAAGAIDLVDSAIVVDSLDEAIGDCGLVVGTSVRSRTIPWPMLLPREFAEKVRVESAATPIAVLFGREQSGLTNEELHRCHFHIQIPSNPDYSSLNIAAAVQVIAYELRMASLALPEAVAQWDYERASVAQMEGFYEHLQQVLVDIDFLNPKVPRQLMPRLRRLFSRVQPDVMEVNILRGILGAVDKVKK